MPVFAPTGDTNNTWTLVGAATAHECVDDPTALPDLDASYLKTTSNATVRLSFSGLVDPGIVSGTKMRVLAKNTSASPSLSSTLRATLTYDATGAPLHLFYILDQRLFPLTNGWLLYEFDVPPETFQFAPNWIVLLEGDVAAGSGDELRVTSVELFVPSNVATQFSRVALEVMAKSSTGPQLQLTRAALEILGKSPATPRAHVTRAGLEVMGRAVTALRVTREALEVMGKTPPPVLQLTRAGLEVMGKNPLFGTGINPSGLPTPLPNLFMANWSERVRLVTSWLVDVVEADTVAEERRILCDRPGRALTIRQTGLRQADAARLWANLKRLCHQRLVTPLYTDPARVTADSSGTTVFCDTATRRFFLGARVVVHAWGADGPTAPTYPIVQGILSDRLLLHSSTPLPQTYPAGSRVFPMLETEVDLEQSGTFVTDGTFDVQLTLHERGGRSALPTSSLDWPAWMPTWAGIPVLDVRVDWGSNVSATLVRAGERGASGRGTVVSVRGERPQVGYEVDVTATSRAQAWQVIQFNDAARGQGRTFWFVAPDTAWRALALTQTTADVAASGNLQDARDFVAYLAVRRTDQSVVVLPVTDVTDQGGGVWRFHFDDPGTPLALGTTRKLTTVLHARQESNEFTEEWETDQACHLHLSVREALREQDVELASVADSIPDVSSPAALPDLVYWLDANAGLKWKNVGPGSSEEPRRNVLAQVGDVVHTLEDVRADPVDPGSYPHTFLAHFQHLYWLGVDDGSLNAGMRTLAVGLGFGDQEHVVYGPGSSPGVFRPVEFVDPGLGFTYVFCGRLNSNPLALSQHADNLLRQSGVVEWLVDSTGADGPTQNVVKLYETLDVANTAHWIYLPGLHTGAHVVLMLVWKPGGGGYARVYQNGSLLGASASVPSTLPTNTARQVSLARLTSFDPSGGSHWSAGDLTADDLILHGATGCLDQVLTYKRALSTSELNQLGTYLRARYGVPFLPIP